MSMAYKLLIADERQWRKDCAMIPKKTLQLLLRRIRALENDPWTEDVAVKKLQDYRVADFRLRVGDYRVLFHKHEETKEIHLLRVLHRSKLY